LNAELQPRHRTVATNGLRLHVVEAGLEGSPVVVLLHGFPEFWYGWRHQIGPLAAAGFHVLAPDQRGYNLSDKPQPVSAYNLDLLAEDVLGLIDQAGVRRAHVVGHDWGGAVAWWLGLKHPDRVEKLALLNIPHPRVMRRTLRRSWAQRRKSAYMAFFQLSGLPEWSFRARRFALPSRILRRTSRPGTFSEADLDRYREAWGQPGAVHTMIHWYRAALRSRPERPAGLRVRVPTLLLWGTEDEFLGREMAQPSIDLCDDGRLEFFEGATHWLHHEEPEWVNARLIEFLS
jgi:pimeloyl-ACP methyl ester carboxylesterase